TKAKGFVATLEEFQEPYGLRHLAKITQTLPIFSSPSQHLDPWNPSHPNAIYLRPLPLSPNRNRSCHPLLCLRPLRAQGKRECLMPFFENRTYLTTLNLSCRGISFPRLAPSFSSLHPSRDSTPHRKC
ncbi:LOW QUALITY PROTEIN: hypothetical protein TorRG33x02_175180, partial [Trema orientale]